MILLNDDIMPREIENASIAPRITATILKIITKALVLLADEIRPSFILSTFIILGFFIFSYNREYTLYYNLQMCRIRDLLKRMSLIEPKRQNRMAI